MSVSKAYRAADDAARGVIPNHRVCDHDFYVGNRVLRAVKAGKCWAMARYDDAMAVMLSTNQRRETMSNDNWSIFDPDKYMSNRSLRALKKGKCWALARYNEAVSLMSALTADIILLP